MKFLYLYIFLLVFTLKSEPVIFKNEVFSNVEFQKANSNVSLQLKEIVETLKKVTEETMKVFGEVAHPFSNVEDTVIINIMLYDIIDKPSKITNSTQSYFSFFDQLKEQGTGIDKPINAISNFGNIIYMDLDPFDPTLDISTSKTNLTTRGLFANKHNFYQAYAESLAKLIHFQRMNANIKDFEIAKNFIDFEYSWLDSALAKFNSFRAMKTLNDNKFGVEEGIKFQVHSTQDANGIFSIEVNEGKALFDTSGAVSNPTVFTDILKNMAPSSMIHFLKNKPDDLPFPNLFYLDEVSESIRNNEMFTKINYSSLSEQLGMLTFIYIWEQLQNLGVDNGILTNLLGDRFIKVLTNLNNTYEIFPGVESDFYVIGSVVPDVEQILTKKTCLEVGVPVDKICQINQALYRLLITEASVADRPDSFSAFIKSSSSKLVKNRNFRDYFDDTLIALYLDQETFNKSDALKRYEIRNFNIAKLDNIYANLAKQNVFEYNIGQRAGVDHRCEIISGSLIDCIPGDLKTFGLEINSLPKGSLTTFVSKLGALTPAEVAALSSTELSALSSVNKSSASSPVLNERQAMLYLLFSNDLSSNRAGVKQYSGDFYKLLNSASTADIAFGIDDIVELKDKSIKKTIIRTSIISKFVGTDSEMKFGTTTYIVKKSTNATDQTSNRVIYVSGFEKSQVLLQDPKASFEVNPSLSRIRSLSKAIRKSKRVVNKKSSAEESLVSSLLKNFSLAKSVGAISGVTQWDRYKTVNEVRTQPEEYNVDTAFRNYTASFKTINFASSTRRVKIFDKNTVVLKEKITGQLSNGNYKILLWVDQQNLPKGDTEVPQAEDTTGDTIDDDPNPTQQVTKAIDVASLNFNSQNNEVGENLNISSLSNLDNPYILKITNNTDDALSINFSLKDSTKASEKFLLTNPSASKSKIAKNWKTLIVTKKSIQYATFAQDAMDISYTINARSVRSFGIANKSNTDEDLLYVLQKVQSSTSNVNDNVVAAVDDGGGGGGCFIATAAYGSLFHPIVKDLVLFRDKVLFQNFFGKVFVKYYYSYSPKVANFIAQSKLLRGFTSVLLLPLWVFAVLSVYSLNLTLILLLLLGLTGLTYLFRLKFR